MSYDTALLNIMNSLANHGCPIVVMTDENTATTDVTKMSKMGEMTADFFDNVINDKTTVNNILPMEHAKE